MYAINDNRDKKRQETTDKRSCTLLVEKGVKKD